MDDVVEVKESEDSDSESHCSRFLSSPSSNALGRRSLSSEATNKRVR